MQVNDQNDPGDCMTEEEIEMTHDEFVSVEFERLFVSSFQALCVAAEIELDPSEEALRWLVGVRCDPMKRDRSADSAIMLDRWYDSPTTEEPDGGEIYEDEPAPMFEVIGEAVYDPDNDLAF